MARAPADLPGKRHAPNIQMRVCFVVPRFREHSEMPAVFRKAAQISAELAHASAENISNDQRAKVPTPAGLPSPFHVH